MVHEAVSAALPQATEAVNALVGATRAGVVGFLRTQLSLGQRRLPGPRRQPGSVVAIKVLLADDPNDPARRKLKQEGRITAQLGRHPDIVQVLATGIDADGSPYVIMDLYDGSVADRLLDGGPMGFPEASPSPI